MLNDGGNENGKTNTQTKKNHVSLATTTKTTTTLHVQNTSFLHFFVVFLHDYSVKFLVTRFLEGTSHVLTKNFVSCVLARFLFHCRSFSPYWPLKFIISIFKFDLFFVLSLAVALSLLRLGFVVAVVFLFLKVRVAKMTITSTFIIMLNTGCSLDTGKQIISHWVRTEGWVDGRKGLQSRETKISRMHE